MPSGIAVTVTPDDRQPRAVRHQPAERSGAEPVARRAVGSGVGEEPARDPDREADDERAGRGRGAAEQGEQHQRTAVPRVDRRAR